MSTHENRLVAALPGVERAQLMALCESVHLPMGMVLGTVGAPTRHAYFPTQSFVSLTVQVNPQHGLEVGLAGSEGMLGAQLSLGMARDSLHAVVQGPGHAWRIEAADLLRELSRSTALQSHLLRYVSVLLGQHALLAACLRFHQIGPRLARWLLMSQDRAHADQFLVTQEFLATVLGVRRVGVTVAAGALQRQGLIKYQRGDLQVVDRVGLEAAACSCYAADQLTYASAMASPA